MQSFDVRSVSLCRTIVSVTILLSLSISSAGEAAPRREYSIYSSARSELIERTDEVVDAQVLLQAESGQWSISSADLTSRQNRDLGRLDETVVSTSLHDPRFDDPDLAAFHRRIGADVIDIVKLPANLDSRAWKRLGLGVLAVAVAGALDDPIHDAIRSDSSAGSKNFALSVRPLAQEGGLAIAGLAVLAGRSLDRPQLTAVAEDSLEATFIAAGLVTPALKAITGRSRPRSGGGASNFGGSSESFPSGEVTQAFAMASVIAAHSDKRWVDATVWSTAGLIAWQRMRLDAHWPSDVVAGALIGSTIGRWVVRRNRPELGRRADWSITPWTDGRGGGANVRVTF